MGRISGTFRAKLRHPELPFPQLFLGRQKLGMKYGFSRRKGWRGVRVDAAEQTGCGRTFDETAPIDFCWVVHDRMLPSGQSRNQPRISLSDI
jgi:hypothetical protein